MIHFSPSRTARIVSANYAEGALMTEGDAVSLALDSDSGS
jgi:hypothetical protein